MSTLEQDIVAVTNILDLEGIITPQLFELLKTPLDGSFNPVLLINELSRSDFIRSQYLQTPNSREETTIGGHTLAVLTLFETQQRGRDALPCNISPECMRLWLSLHDIVKGVATERGVRNRHGQLSYEIAKKVFNHLSYPVNQLDLLGVSSDDDILGSHLRRVRKLARKIATFSSYRPDLELQIAANAITEKNGDFISEYTPLVAEDAQLIINRSINFRCFPVKYLELHAIINQADAGSYSDLRYMFGDEPNKDFIWYSSSAQVLYYNLHQKVCMN